MNLIQKFLTTITQRTRLTIAVLLVVTLLLSGGIPMVEEDTSLDQFETESDEVDKLEYVGENFGVAEENTTTAQVVLREDNALSRDSLIASLELQQDIQASETINATLVDDPFNDLATILAQTALIEERQAELDERSEQLENESAGIQADSEALEADSAALEQRQQAIEDDQEELERLAVELSELLDEARDVQTEYNRGEITEAERDAASDELSTTAAERLTQEQSQAFDELLEQAQATQAEMSEVQRAYEENDIDEDEYETQMAELTDTVEAVYAGIEDEVLADSFADLQQRGEEIEADAQELDERGEELEGRSAELEERGNELEDEYMELGELEPTTDEAIEKLESMDEDEVAELVASTLDEEADSGLFTFLPTSYEPGSTEADARMLFVTQETPEATGMEGEAPDVIVDSQLEMQSLVDDRFADGFVFGAGIIADEMDRSLADSMAIVLPLALLFVTLVLVVAYRDILDIALGILGILFVLIWTFGFMGWTGISFNIVMIAVPVLLVGLSVDYAIHVFMRHREQRGLDRESTRKAMFVALSGVGIALIWVTATAVIGFLSNLISPIGPLREFGVTSAFGITAALLIFGILIPALKLETDTFLESRGFNRQKRAFGTGGGIFTSVLSVGQILAGRTPAVILVVSLVLTAGGIAGATQVDTSFEQEDFLADEPPAWMQSLPEPFAPGEYSVKANTQYVNENFLRQDTQANILIEGNVTHSDTGVQIAEATENAATKNSTVILSDGSADVTSPLTTMQDVAEQNESFNQTFTEADTTGDAIPDQNVSAVFDALFEADEQAASQTIYRTADGEYDAVQIIISVHGGATGGDVTEDMRSVAATIDSPELQATATGQLIVFYIIESELFDTVIDSLLITLVAVFAFLMLGYRWAHGSAILGAVTLLPIVFTVAWILGTMYLLGISFNVMTGTITSLTVGLGIAYNIHMSERYMLERKRGKTMLDALYIAVTGTGGALLGSAATTIGGFGVLMFAILPPLQQFGLITGVTILYAFLGSVFVLPSFLVLWSKYFGPTDATVPDETDQSATGTSETP